MPFRRTFSPPHILEVFVRKLRTNGFYGFAVPNKLYANTLKWVCFCNLKGWGRGMVLLFQKGFSHRLSFRLTLSLTIFSSHLNFRGNSQQNLNKKKTEKRKQKHETRSENVRRGAIENRISLIVGTSKDIFHVEFEIRGVSFPPSNSRPSHSAGYSCSSYSSCILWWNRSRN